MYIKHILGEFNIISQTQSCIICGEVIHNYQGTMISSPNSQEIKLGWNPGEHYVKEGFPTIFASDIVEGEKFINCNEK